MYNKYRADRATGVTAAISVLATEMGGRLEDNYRQCTERPPLLANILELSNLYSILLYDTDTTPIHWHAPYSLCPLLDRGD